MFKIKIAYIIFTIMISCLFGCKTDKKITEKSCNYITDYHPYVIEAEIAYLQDDFNKAYSLLSKAFLNCKPRNTVPYYEIDKMAKITAILGYNEETVKMINFQFENGFTINKYKDDELFAKLFRSKEGIEIENGYETKRQEYLNSIDTSLVKKIIYLSACDQQYRSNNQKENKRREQEILDSINEIEIKNIFENYGYPEEHLSRYAYPDMIRMNGILLHTQDSIRINYFLPKLFEFVKNGQCDPKIYGEVYDQYYLYNKQPQIYGTYTNRDRSLSNSIDMKILNENRTSIGLASLKIKDSIHQLKIKKYPNSYGKIYKKNP